MVKPPPANFIQFKKNGRYYLQCSKSIATSKGIIKCQYIVRKDSSKLEHKCSFESLDNYSLTKVKKKSSQPELKIPIIDSLLGFISETNVSFRAACSDSMKNLIMASIAYGMENGSKRIEAIMPRFNRSDIAKKFKNDAVNKKERSLGSLKNQYACLTMDSSTDISQSCLDILVSHPFLHPTPIVVDSIESFGGSTANYREEFKKAIEYLAKKSITVAGITTDNLLAQVQAVSPRSESSFQYQSLNPNDKYIMWISCICHVIALGIKVFFKKDPYETMLDDLNILVHTLRRKPIRQFIKSTIPAPSTTRWNVIYYQMMWIINHEDSLVKLVHCNSPTIRKYTDPIRDTIAKVMIEVIPSLAPSLQLVAAAVDTMQSDSFQASYTFSVLDVLKKEIICTSEVMEAVLPECDITSVVINSNKKAAVALTSSIDFMVQKHANPLFLQLIYVLTPEGRNDFRRGYPVVVAIQDPDDVNIGQKGFNKQENKRNQIFKYIAELEALKDELLNLEEEETKEEEEEEEEELSDSYSYEEDEETPTSHPLLAETNDTRSIDPNDPTALFVSLIEEILILTHERNEVNLATQCFLNWLMQSTDTLKITPMILENPFNLWSFLKTKSEWTTLADFVLRSLSLVGSEAGVERLFSQHKHVIDHLRRRTSREMRIARLSMKQRE